MLSQCFLGQQEAGKQQVALLFQTGERHMCIPLHCPLHPVCPLVSPVYKSSAGAARQPGQGLQILRCLFSTQQEEGAELAACWGALEEMGPLHCKDVHAD